MGHLLFALAAGALLACIAAAAFAPHSQRNARATAPRTFAAFALAVGLAGFTAAPAFAAEGAFDTTPDNELAATLGDDAVWAGQNKTFSKVNAPNDILAAGQTIAIKDSTVGGSIRAAGETTTVANTAVSHSVTLAAQTANVSNVTAQAVALAAGEASFSGECDSLYIFAENAVINGTVHGDVVVRAENIQLGPDANIEGTVRGAVGDDLNVSDNATYETLELAHGENDNAAESSFDFVSLFGSIIYSALACLVTAAAIEWLARKHTANAAELAKTRMGYVAASGIIGAIAAPVVVIILCCLVITLPLAGALALGLFALTIIACGYTAAVLGKLAFKSMGRFPAAIAMGAIVGAASALPFVGTVVFIACFAFALGCVLQAMFLGTKDRSANNTVDMPPMP